MLLPSSILLLKVQTYQEPKIHFDETRKLYLHNSHHNSTVLSIEYHGRLPDTIWLMQSIELFAVHTQRYNKDHHPKELRQCCLANRITAHTLPKASQTTKHKQRYKLPGRSRPKKLRCGGLPVTEAVDACC